MSLEQHRSSEGTTSPQPRPRRKLGFLDFFYDVEWEEIRQQGRAAYVRSRVIGVGIPVGSGLAVWHVLHMGYSMSEVLSGKGLLMLAAYVATSAATAFFGGRSGWVTRERLYRESRDKKRQARG